MKTVDFRVYVDLGWEKVEETDRELVYKERVQTKKRICLALNMVEWDQMMSLQGMDRERFLKSLI